MTGSLQLVKKPDFKLQTAAKSSSSSRMESIFFDIHCSKLKPDPFGDLGEATCISTYIHSKYFPCEGSNPARGLKYPNVIPHFFKSFFGIWVAKKPDISEFFLHVILLVMLIWLRRLATYFTDNYFPLYSLMTLP